MVRILTCVILGLTDEFFHWRLYLLITTINTDAELAAYVHGVMPQPWRSRCDVRAIEISLERVRLDGSASNIDERVGGALARLGIPVTPSIMS